MSMDELKRLEAQQLGHFADYCDARTGIALGKSYDQVHGIPTAIDFNYIVGQRKISDAINGMWQAKRKIDDLKHRR